uniref:Uncharacterized protein n=1 Tax=Phaeodactylum tricornutum TaxID=2850 RepID=A0A8J9X492_PHATR
MRRTAPIWYALLWPLVLLQIHSSTQAWSAPTCTRRTLLHSWTMAGVAVAGGSNPAHAAADCYADCFQNCKAIAPKDLGYCKDSCRDYCAQPDRRDGLSGSVSSAGGEMGLLGGGFPGSGTVVKGQDKPPSVTLPGLDFSSGIGKKLIGY